jgi:predicted nucleic acid-binding protein
LLIESFVDKGEASAIALALESENSLLIIDDRKGRKFARQLGLSIIGTIGIIVDAKLAGIIPSVKPSWQKLKQQTSGLRENWNYLFYRKQVNSVFFIKTLRRGLHKKPL